MAEVFSLSLCSCHGARTRRCPGDGHTQGKQDNSMGSCFLDDNTVAPHSDSRILKNRKKQSR